MTTRQSARLINSSAMVCYVTAATVFSAYLVEAAEINSVQNGEWSDGATWSDGLPPTPGNTYTILNGHVVSGPLFTDTIDHFFTFDGDSLTVQSGGTLMLHSGAERFNATAEYTMSDITLESGSTLSMMTNIGNIDRTLLGNLILPQAGTVTFVAESETSNSFNNSLTLSSGALIGGADIDFQINALGQPGLRKFLSVATPNNPYTGNWTVTTANAQDVRLGALIAAAENALGTGTVTLNAGLLRNEVDGGLNSLAGVTAIAPISRIEAAADWINPNAFLRLNAAPTSLLLLNDGTLVSIGNLSGVAGSEISSIDPNTMLQVNITEDSVFDGLVAGTLGLTKDGPARLLLSQDNTYSGPTTISAGVLEVNGTIAASAFSTAGAGRLEGVGSVASLTNSGIVAPGPLPGTGFGTMTVLGNYVGAGGIVEIEAALNGDGSPTDMLVVQGNTSGTSLIDVINRDGQGGVTVNGIKIIDVLGVSDGVFSLLGDYEINDAPAIVAGAYAYQLYKNGIVTPADGNWYLRSALLPTDPDEPLFQAGAPLYETYAQHLLSLGRLPTLQERIGNRSWSTGAANQPADGLVGGQGFWTRLEGEHLRRNPIYSTADILHGQDIWRAEAGIDQPLYQSAAGVLFGGLSLHYAGSQSAVTSPHGDGVISTNGSGLGGTLTWYGDDGLYADGQAQLSWYGSDLTSTTADLSLVRGNGGFGSSFSAELGKRIALADDLTLTPQAQLIYSTADFHDFTDAFGAPVTLEKAESLRARVGISLDKQAAWQAANGTTSRSHIYGGVNLYQELLGASRIKIEDTDFDQQNERTWAGLELGASLELEDGKYTVFGAVAANTGLENFGKSYDLTGKLGFSVRW